MNSVELLDKKGLLKEEALRMIDQATSEIRCFTDEEKVSYEAIKNQILTINEELRNLEETLAPETKTTKSNFQMETRNFSLLSAVRNCANNCSMDEVTAAVVEAGANEMRKSGLSYSGQIQLPLEERAITVAAEGADVVPVEIMDIVKPLQARNVMVAAGCKFLSGLVGDVQYPVMSKVACSWEGETDEASDSEITFSNVKLTPKRLTCVVPISKQFLVQDSVGAENAIREEIINAINAKLEATIFSDEARNATRPGGLTGTFTDIASFKELVDFEAAIEEANVTGEMKYIMSPKAKAALRGMAKSANSPQLVYENGEVDGTPSLVTTHLGQSYVVYGDFSQFIIAQWGSLDILVDSYTLASKGMVRLVVTGYFDALPLRPEAIKAGYLV